MVIGCSTRANSSTSTANTIMMPVTMAMTKLAFSSFMSFASPMSTWRTPCGRFFKVGSARIFFIAVPSSTPSLRSASIDSGEPGCSAARDSVPRRS